MAGLRLGVVMSGVNPLIARDAVCSACGLRRAEFDPDKPMMARGSLWCPALRDEHSWAAPRTDTAALDDQLINGPFCTTHGRVGSTIDGKCGRCYGVGRALDDRVIELEATVEALTAVLRRVTSRRYAVRRRDGVVALTNQPFDGERIIVDLHEGPF